MQTLTANREQMKIWADNCPENFQHNYLLIAAETARIEGKELEIAATLYDQAIQAAHNNERTQYEALGNELAAKLFLARGLEKMAAVYIREAHYLYRLWGATRKVENLEEEYPWLTQTTTERDAIRITTSTRDSETTTGSKLDLASVVKASQAISSEIALDKLLARLIRIVIENAGAQRGCLVLARQERLSIEAEWAIDQAGLWIVQADAGNIEQVIMNLAINARDAMPTGGRLTIKTENIVLDESCGQISPDARPGKFICISVEDTGRGIDPESMSHIFEPFFTTKETGQGTGLGLSVVYGIVTQHQGWINVYSEVGQGTIFKAYLPASLTGRREVEVEERLTLKNLQGQGQRILLVKDEEGVRKFAGRVLISNGYVVFEAANAGEALAIFEKEEGNIDLLFSDVVLPDQSGLELIEQLLSYKPELPVLLSSGYTGTKSQWPIIREREFYFLQKPYPVADLLKAIKEVLIE